MIVVCPWCSDPKCQTSSHSWELRLSARPRGACASVLLNSPKELKGKVALLQFLFALGAVLSVLPEDHADYTGVGQSVASFRLFLPKHFGFLLCLLARSITSAGSFVGGCSQILQLRCISAGAFH